MGLGSLNPKIVSGFKPEHYSLPWIVFFANFASLLFKAPDKTPRPRVPHVGKHASTAPPTFPLLAADEARINTDSGLYQPQLRDDQTG